MNPEPFQRLVKLLEKGQLSKEEFSKEWDKEKKRQEETFYLKKIKEVIKR